MNSTSSRTSIFNDMVNSHLENGRMGAMVFWTHTETDGIARAQMKQWRFSYMQRKENIGGMIHALVAAGEGYETVMAMIFSN